jgi:hypothetical protein
MGELKRIRSADNLTVQMGLDFRPSALIRDVKVVGFMPSNSAAPRGPEILPFAWARAAMMLSRSRRFRSDPVRIIGSAPRVEERKGQRNHAISSVRGVESRNLMRLSNLKEVCSQQRNVFAAFPQGRDFDRENAEPSNRPLGNDFCPAVGSACQSTGSAVNGAKLRSVWDSLPGRFDCSRKSGSMFLF